MTEELRKQYRNQFILFTIVTLLVGTTLGIWGYRAYRSRLLSDLSDECRKALQAQDWNHLNELAEEWLWWVPEADDALLYLGESRQQLGDLEGAVEAIHRIPDNSPKIHPALLIAADIQLGALNQPFEAEKSLQRLLGINPTSMAAQRRLLYFYGVTMQRQKLIEQIRHAIRHQSDPPESYVYLMLADHLSFSNGFSEAEKWLRGNESSEILQVARILLLMDRIENAETPPSEVIRKRAEETLKNVSEKFPENSALGRYLLERAAAKFQLDEFPSLLKRFSAAVAEDSVLCRYQAWYYARTGKISQAEKWLRRSLELYKLDWHTWHELAGVLRQSGKLEEAEVAAEIALIGKALRKELVQLPTANDVTPNLLKQVREFAIQVGEEEIAKQVDNRLPSISSMNLE